MQEQEEEVGMEKDGWVRLWRKNFRWLELFVKCCTGTARCEGTRSQVLRATSAQVSLISLALALATLAWLSTCSLCLPSV